MNTTTKTPASIANETFTKWSEILVNSVKDAISPYKAKRLAPFITEEAQNKAANRSLHVFKTYNESLVKQFERKQNEIAQAIEENTKLLQEYKRRPLKWHKIPALRNELKVASGMLDGMHIGVTLIATNKPQ
jgi:hypothetical protein